MIDDWNTRHIRWTCPRSGSFYQRFGTLTARSMGAFPRRRRARWFPNRLRWLRRGSPSWCPPARPGECSKIRHPEQQGKFQRLAKARRFLFCAHRPACRVDAAEAMWVSSPAANMRARPFWACALMGQTLYTLAPIATLLGVAFILYDPTTIWARARRVSRWRWCPPTSRRRHRPPPLPGAPFMNGPTSGKDVPSPRFPDRGN